MPTPLAIVTAADSAYFRLFQGLVHSLASAGIQDASLCVIDIGLSPAEREWAVGRAARVEDGRWDFDFPGRAERPQSLQGFTCRPYLPRYFPGYETYLWIDADAWVQDRRAVELFVEAAADGSIGVVPEIDRSYRIHYDMGAARRWLHRAYRRSFGKEAADLLWWNPNVNAGVFSLREDSACWSVWADLLLQALTGVSAEPDAGDHLWWVDQIALNYGIFTEVVPAQFLPSTANWMCSYATPLLDDDTGRLLHPRLPYEVLGIVHLAGRPPKAGPASVATTGGDTVTRWLTFEGGPL